MYNAEVENSSGYFLKSGLSSRQEFEIKSEAQENLTVNKIIKG